MILCLAILTALTYAQVWRFEFVYDDLNWVHWAPTLESESWRYLAKMPFTFAAWLGGGLPWAFHGVVVLLHLVNGLLLWAIARKWLSVSASLLCLTLFWLHPIQTEAVAYVSGGMEVLLTSYVLVAVWCGLDSRWLVAVFGAVALVIGVTLKLSALPALIAVPAVWLMAKERHSLMVWSLIASAVYLLAVPAVIVWTVTHRADLATRIQSLNMVLLECWRYLALVIYPRWFSIEHTFNPAWAWLAGVASGLVLFVALTIRKAWIAPFICMLWIACWLLPRGLMAIHGTPLTEHHTYVLFLPIWLSAGSFLDHVVLKGQTAHG